MKSFADQLCDIASKEIGTQEVDGSNCGPRVNQYKAATNLDPELAWPWCAAFICWVVREAMKAAGVNETETFHRPTTAGAWDLENWSLRQDLTTRTKRVPGRDIAPGDIVIFTFSHVGLAITKPDADGYFYTVEGNTDVAGSREGGGVFQKVRRIGQVKTRIRFKI